MKKCKCTGMPLYMWEQYQDFLNSKIKEVIEPEKEYWYFKFGDVVPKQGYQTFRKYYQDAACQVPKSIDSLKKDILNLKDTNNSVKTRTQFGITMRC